MKNSIDIKVLIMATMSAGKSTLINAIIGEDVFPTRNQACTSKVMIYTIDNRLQNIKIRNKIDNVYENISVDNIAKLNEDELIEKIELTGPIKSNIAINHRISIIDTPGVNNSQDKSHLEITYKELEKGDFDTIIYVINATQVGIDDDAKLLSKLNSYLKDNKKDVVFVINKIDTMDCEKESINDIYEDTIKYIRKKSGIDKPKVICTSAYISNIIKKEMYGHGLTRKEMRDIKLFKNEIEETNISYEEYTNITKSKKISKKTHNKNYELLKKTGLVNIEDYLANIKSYNKTSKSSEIYKKNIELMNKVIKNKNNKIHYKKCNRK